MSEKKQISAYVDEDKKEQIRITAAKEGVGMSEWIRQAVLDKLEQAEQGNRKAMAMAD